MKGGDYLRWFTKLKAAINGAITGWKGQGFDFTSWIGRTFWGIDNSTLATNETIFSVITRLSNSLASLPLKLYRNYDIASNQAADILINGPNANMTSFEFIRNLETIRNEKGNSYALIERDIRGQVARLTPLNPDYVEPVFDTDTGDLWYQVIGNKGTYYFHNMDILHFKHIIGSGGIKGISPLKVLTNTNDFDKAVRDFSLKEMQSAPNSFILKYAANVDMEKRQRVIDDFKRFYQDNGGILFQEPGVEIDPIERKFIAADIFTSERITRSRVANVFNVPAHMLNDSEGQSYSSMEQLMREFVQLTLMPIVRQYEQEFNRKLLSPAERQDGFYFKFNVNALLRGDTATQSDYYMKGIRTGWLKPNEVRQLEDLPPEPGGEKLYLSGDLYPIDMDPSLRKGVKAGGNATTN